MTEHAPVEGKKELEVHSTSTLFLVTDELDPRALLGYHIQLGKWLPVGGHRDPTNNSLQAAINEGREESGFDATKYLPRPIRLDEVAMLLPTPRYTLLEYIPAYKNRPEHLHQDSIYVVRVPYFEPVRSEGEQSAIGWFTYRETEGLDTYDNIHMLLADILKPTDSIDEAQE